MPVISSAYILVIVSFVAMGGPKATTPTLDHIEFASKESCEAGGERIAKKLMARRVDFSYDCVAK